MRATRTGWIAAALVGAACGSPQPAADVTPPEDAATRPEVSAPEDSSVAPEASAPIDAAPPTDAATDATMDAADAAPRDAAVAMDASDGGYAMPEASAPVDVMIACPPGTIRCGAVCTDNTTNLNCGACGAVCPVGTACMGGSCQCPAGLTRCGDVCLDTTSDPRNCGLCNNACGAGLSCNGGMCTVTCTAPRTTCTPPGGSPTCVDTRTSLDHCGACNSRCAPAPNSVPVCSLGRCAASCAPGFGDCDGSAANGCEVDVRGSVAHCGACGRACPLAPNARAVCASGACGLSCNVGFANCDGSAANGCETNVTSSTSNCGACGRACPIPLGGSPTCTSGACGVACLPGRVQCSPGTCSDLATDASNCGRCGNACPAGRACAAGACVGGWATSPAPVSVPNSTGCTLLLDTNADQVDISPDGAVFVLMRCGSELRIARSTDGARSFAPATQVPFPMPTTAAAVHARSATDVVVLAGFMPTNAMSMRSTNGGLSWSPPVQAGPNFSSSGPGPALTITERAGVLFATWSAPGATASVFQSTNLGASWAPFGVVNFMGTNYCPDLFVAPSGELLIANEVNREVFRSSPVAPTWSPYGSLLPGSAFTDFAVGGTFIYGTGNSNTIQRGAVTAVVSTSATSTVSNTNSARSMDADSAGNLAFSLNDGTGAVLIYSWRAGFAAIDAPFRWTLPTGATPSAFPATAAIPTVRGSVTALAGSAVFVQVVVP